MPSHLSPYISFRGEAREAMEFYRSVLGGTLEVSTFGEFGAPEGVDPEHVMHAQLTTGAGWLLMGSDVPPGMSFDPGSRITVALFGDDADLLRRAFAGLSEGGTVETPLEEQMWGDEYGALVDRYGVNWMVNLSPPAPGAAS